MQFGANLRGRNGLLLLLLSPFRFLRSFGNKSRIYLLLLSFPPFPLPPPPYIAERKYSRGKRRRRPVKAGRKREGGSLPLHLLLYYTVRYYTRFPSKVWRENKWRVKRAIFRLLRERAGNTIDFSSAFLRKMWPSIIERRYEKGNNKASERSVETQTKSPQHPASSRKTSEFFIIVSCIFECPLGTRLQIVRKVNSRPFWKRTSSGNRGMSRNCEKGGKGGLGAIEVQAVIKGEGEIFEG